MVRVDDGTISLLLTGDIELEAERKLVALEKQALNSTFIYLFIFRCLTMAAAHRLAHYLLRSVAGKAAFASVARYNAWRMPAQAVVERYQQQGYIWV